MPLSLRLCANFGVPVRDQTNEQIQGHQCKNQVEEVPATKNQSQRSRHRLNAKRSASPKTANVHGNDYNLLLHTRSGVIEEVILLFSEVQVEYSEKSAGRQINPTSKYYLARNGEECQHQSHHRNVPFCGGGCQQQKDGLVSQSASRVVSAIHDHHSENLQKHLPVEDGHYNGDDFGSTNGEKS